MPEDLSLIVRALQYLRNKNHFLLLVGCSLGDLAKVTKPTSVATHSRCATGSLSTALSQQDTLLVLDRIQ